MDQISETSWIGLQLPLLCNAEVTSCAHVQEGHSL